MGDGGGAVVRSAIRGPGRLGAIGGHRCSLVVRGADRCTGRVGATGYPRCVVMSRMTDQIGRVLSGRYRLIAPIGTGASAQVYLADDVRLRRRVAVKVLHAALAEDDAFLRRFRAEAQAAAALNHPHIVAVYDWGDDDGAPYIVTEYLGGGSLRAVLDRGVRLDPVAGADDRPRGHAGPRLRPPPRLRAPRHQAGQPPLRRRRPAAHRRLRSGPRPGRGGVDRAAGRRARHRSLRLARAGPGPGGRRQGRRVLARPRPDRVRHRHRARSRPTPPSPPSWPASASRSRCPRPSGRSASRSPVRGCPTRATAPTPGSSASR